MFATPDGNLQDVEDAIGGLVECGLDKCADDQSGLVILVVGGNLLCRFLDVANQFIADLDRLAGNEGNILGAAIRDVDVEVPRQAQQGEERLKLLSDFQILHNCHCKEGQGRLLRDRDLASWRPVLRKSSCGTDEHCCDRKHDLRHAGGAHHARTPIAKSVLPIRGAPPGHDGPAHGRQWQQCHRLSLCAAQCFISLNSRGEIDVNQTGFRGRSSAPDGETEQEGRRGGNEPKQEPALDLALNMCEQFRIPILGTHSGRQDQPRSEATGYPRRATAPITQAASRLRPMAMGNATTTTSLSGGLSGVAMSGTGGSWRR